MTDINVDYMGWEYTWTATGYTDKKSVNLAKDIMRYRDLADLAQTTMADN
jgi:hypothetical protein